MIYPVSYTPELPTLFYGLKDDSPQKIIFFQNYLNLLLENKYFRTLPLFYDFITLPKNEWNNKIKYTYNKIKITEKFDQMPNFDGKHFCKIN